MASSKTAVAARVVRSRKQNPVDVEDTFDEKFVRVAGDKKSWRVGTGVYIDCDDRGYCVVRKAPSKSDEIVLRHRNPVEVAKKAVKIIAYGKVDPNAPRTPDRAGG